jgi:integrase/recombinase XerD
MTSPSDFPTPSPPMEAVWLTRFDDALRARRLAPSSVVRYQEVATHFFAWWHAHHPAGNVSAAVRADVDAFVAQHLRVCRCSRRCRRAPHENRAALRHLWGARPEVTQVAGPRSSVDREIERYQAYLREVCGAAEATQVYRVRYVGALLKELFGHGVVDHGAIGAAALTLFVTARTSSCRPSSMGVVTSALRSYVRYLTLQGLAGDHLCEAIPAVARWRLASVPQRLEPDEWSRLLRSFRRRDPRGRRDFAMTRCMMDLGLRAGEVAGLQLGDIEWRAGTLMIRATKTRRSRVLPMPAGLGRTLVSYLRVRPTTPHRHLFVRLGVLHGDPVTASVVRSAVRLAYRRAGLPPTYTGTHRLRHSVATRLVSAGASLKEVADVLGHTSLDSTAIYTKVDLPRLRRVALPWGVA